MPGTVLVSGNKIENKTERSLPSRNLQFTERLKKTGGCNLNYDLNETKINYGLKLVNVSG